MIGPVISVLSFVCSIGNVPLAAVLWNGGISFGGVVAFIFADLIIIPILVIYRKYYGTKMMLTVLAIFYVTMVIAGYAIEFIFGGLGLIPAERTAKVAETGIQWNYTTVLNIIFLLLAAALLVRFFRSGGAAMLKAMGGSPAGREQQGHEQQGHEQHEPGPHRPGGPGGHEQPAHASPAAGQHGHGSPAGPRRHTDDGPAGPWRHADDGPAGPWPRGRRPSRTLAACGRRPGSRAPAHARRARLDSRPAARRRAGVVELSPDALARQPPFYS